jgi:hypothetical protein
VNASSGTGPAIMGFERPSRNRGKAPKAGPFGEAAAAVDEALSRG